MLWTIGYDTIYAHQDKEDDAGDRAEIDGAQVRRCDPALAHAFYAGAVVLWGLAGALAGARLAFFLALALAGVQLAWQVATLDTADPANCLARFRSNRLIGWLLFVGLVADMGLGALLDAR